MRKALFTADEFIPTAFSTAEDKAAFGNHFFRFIESEWKQTVFTKGFYNRLSMCFSHIAHYNLHEFYAEWFAEDARRLDFLRHTLAYPCYGGAAYTFCDVERAIISELRRRNLVAQYEARVAADVRARELAQLERLQAKYSAVPVVVVPVTAPPSHPPQHRPRPQTAPVQISLF